MELRDKTKKQPIQAKFFYLLLTKIFFTAINIQNMKFNKDYDKNNTWK